MIMILGRSVNWRTNCR